MGFFSMVLFSSANSDTGLDFTYWLLRDAIVSKHHSLQALCSVVLKVPLGWLVYIAFSSGNTMVLY